MPHGARGSRDRHRKLEKERKKAAKRAARERQLLQDASDTGQLLQDDHFYGCQPPANQSWADLYELEQTHSANPEVVGEALDKHEEAHVSVSASSSQHVYSEFRGWEDEYEEESDDDEEEVNSDDEQKGLNKDII